jgi:Uri superfamily endonuclease
MVKKGSYVLLLELNNSQNIRIGKKGIMEFQPGYYVYVGSAMNGLDQRLHRHMKSEKKYHWHIDYLLEYAHLVDAYYKEHRKKEECSLAALFSKTVDIIPGFGCSDCHCTSHLFYGNRKRLEEMIHLLEMKKVE